METRMITLFCKDVPDMDKGELEAELRAQKWLRHIIKKAYDNTAHEGEGKKPSWIRDNKLEFCELYLTNIEALIAEIEFYIPRRAHEDLRHSKGKRKKEESAQRAKAQGMDKDTRIRLMQQFAREGINLQWNKELFMLVGKDRGYQTEEALIYAVQEELGLTRTKAKILVDKGRFTWGQVLCVGAMLEMTPKEFCDVFMSGYFVEYMGEYYASHQNIDKSALLTRRVLPDVGANTESSD